MTALDSLRQQWEPLRLRIAAGPLPGWWAQIRDAWWSLLPQRARDLLASNEQRVWFAITGHSVQVLEINDDHAHPLGEVPLGDEPVLSELASRIQQRDAPPRWLLLSAQQVLRRRLPLPVAAEPKLRDVLAFEIDRQTPFAADQVVYEGRVVNRLADGKQLDVELLVVPRTRLDALRQSLGPMAVGLTGIDVADTQGLPSGINLLPVADRPKSTDHNRTATIVLAAVTLLAFVLAGFASKANRAEALVRMQDARDAAQTDARQARTMLAELKQAAEAANFLAAQRATKPTALEVIDDVTRRLPDDTYLERLNIEQTRLVINGQSRTAPQLVALLQESQLLKSPALGGAVQSDPTTKLDRFMLTAEIVNQPAAAKKPPASQDQPNPSPDEPPAETTGPASTAQRIEGGANGQG